MIRRLEIRNFKSHKDTVIDCGNLTVLSGVNSAGKSSLVQSLLLLRQTFLTGRLENGLELNGVLCRIGTKEDARFRFADNGQIEFCIRDDHAELRFDYDVKDKDALSDFVDACDMSCRLADGEEFGFEAIKEGKLKDLSLFSNAFQYVSALRWGGRSHFDQFNYEVEKHQQISVELGQGEAVAHFLHKYGKDPEFDTCDYSCDDVEQSGKCKLTLIEQVEKWERLICKDISVFVQKGERNGFDILYGHAYPLTKPLEGLKAENIGYGISHVLPVLTALLSAQPNALVVLENPEAHLHPGAQAELAKLIARVAQAGVQVIVETHSDHIINGILLATKLHEDGKRGLDREKVKMYFFDKDEKTQTFTIAKEVKIVERGRLEKQPLGFFDQAEKDLFAIDGY